MADSVEGLDPDHPEQASNPGVGSPPCGASFSREGPLSPEDAGRIAAHRWHPLAAISLAVSLEACVPGADKATCAGNGAGSVMPPMLAPRSTAVPRSYEMRPAPTGSGGGFVTGIDIATDGSHMVCDTDVFNGYVRRADTSAWSLLLRSDNMPRREIDPIPNRVALLRAQVGNGANNGTFSTRVAPSAAGTIFTAWNGLLLRSTDTGQTFAITCLEPRQFLADTGPSRRFTRSIDIHPGNPDAVLVGTNGDGCYFSNDGFRQHFLTLDLPDTDSDYSGTPAPYLVAFAPDGIPYVHVYGTGLFHAPRGGEGQFLFLGGPATASCLSICPTTGAVYLCEFRTSNTQVKDALHVLQGGDWRRIAGSDNADQLAIDPHDPRHFIWANENGGWFRTRDGGETLEWSNVTAWRGQGESGWLSCSSKRVYPSQVLFDPVVANRFWLAEGVGVNFADLDEEGEHELVLHDANNGIQELLATCGISAHGRPTNLLGVMDKGVWRVEDGRVSTWHYCPHPGSESNLSAVAHMRSLDFATDDAEYLAGIFNQDGSNGYSEDWGLSWTPFPAPPGKAGWLPGGDIAVSERDNIVIAEANNGGLWFTKAGGRESTDWQPVRLRSDGEQESHAINAHYVQRDCLTADKTQPGTFAYLHNNDFVSGRDGAGNWIHNPDAGIWVNRTGGEGNWEHTRVGVIGSNPRLHTAQFWQARLSYIPGRPGELLYSALIENDRPEFKLCWITKDGAGDLIELPPSMVRGFDFGMPITGAAFPSLWFWGMVDGRKGLYVTFDWFKTAPHFISSAPGGSIGGIGDGLVADKNKFGRCYLGLKGNGWLEIQGS